MHRSVFLLAAVVYTAAAQEPCTLSTTHDQFRISHVKRTPKLKVGNWRGPGQTLSKDCYRQTDYPDRKTTIKGFWTDTDLYVLFRCPYGKLNVFENPNNKEARMNLWDRDVVEMFVGDDFENIRHYREFEVAPTGDWIDLAIDLNKNSYDHSWRSGWETQAKVDGKHKVWYAAARIPLKSISEKPVAAGTRWRINFYRIDGPGGNDTRHFMCWQQTCSHQHGNHTPESFGTLLFER